MNSKLENLPPVTLVCLCIISLLSCIVQRSNTSITYIRYGTSFGMCEGYCFNEKMIDPSFTTTISKAQGRSLQKNLPDKTDTSRTSSEQWRSLLDKIDTRSFFKLPERIGCPDCADGGAEWIEIGTGTTSHKVVFEKGADIEQLRDLLELLRKTK